MLAIHRIAVGGKRRFFMKSKHLFAVALLMSCAGGVFAACSSTIGGFMNANGTNGVRSLLSGNTICSPANCTNKGSCSWQEYHNAGGRLIEMHSGDPGDPSEDVGTWAITTPNGNTAMITHGYTIGGSYSYYVQNNQNGTYSFCTGTSGTEYTFTVKGGQARCP